MGGEREGTVSTQSEEPKVEEKSGVMGTGNSVLRFHQNAGEIHFHDDGAGLKWAGSVADYWAAWNKLKTLQFGNPSRWTSFDEKNGTMLTIEMSVRNNKRECFVYLEKFTVESTNSIFDDLDKFIKGRS